jgi:pimeloyl-ACP methyl ester carboxylesterase
VPNKREDKAAGLAASNRDIVLRSYEPPRARLMDRDISPQASGIGGRRAFWLNGSDGGKHGQIPAEVKMRLPLLLAALLWSACSTAQGPNPPYPIYGVDYTAERVIALRQVDDGFDKGTIRLASHVYRPLKNDRREVVVSLHGSLGGISVWPGQPLPAQSYIPLLIRRGYTVVLPMRRGIGESTGQYVEECAYHAGKCTLADYRTMTERALADAMLSTEAVIEQVVLRKLKPAKGTFLLWGGSRGAFLALHYAARHPEQVRGVVAVSTGWLSMPDKWPVPEIEQRLSMQKKILADVGRRYPGPTLWVYADRDPFYSETLSRQLFEAFRSGGGTGRYFQVRDENLKSGHVPPVPHWLPEAESFLDQLSK